MNLNEKLIFAYMIALIIALIVFCIALVINNRKLADKCKLAEAERDESKLKIMLMQQQLKTICELLPNPDQANPFENDKAPDVSGGVFLKRFVDL